MRAALALATCLGAAFLASGDRPAGAAPERSPSGLVGDVRLVTLKNGLRLVLAPDPDAWAVDVAVWYEAGTRYDRAGKLGLAHLFEHLMFQGSSRFGADEHGRRIRAEGGTSGAMAVPDFTCFYETLPPEALEVAFELEADRMAGLQITQAALDADRAVAHLERVERAGPFARGRERLAELVFAGHPYRWPLLGTEADVGRLTVQDCREFYRAHYAPNRAVVTVVGRFHPEDAVRWAKKHLEPLRAASGRLPQAPPPPRQAAERRGVERHGAPVRLLLSGWSVPARSDPAWASFSLLLSVLASGTQARLHRALVEEDGLCLSVQGDLDGRRDASLFYLAAALAPQADSAEVERRLFQEVERLAAHRVSDDELERARRHVETAVWFGLQTSRGRAQALGTSLMVAGDARDLATQLERVRACTAEDLRRAAGALDGERRTVLWMLPAGAAAGPSPASAGSQP